MTNKSSWGPIALPLVFGLLAILYLNIGGSDEADSGSVFDIFSDPNALNETNIKNALQGHVVNFPCTSLSGLGADYLGIKRDQLASASSIDDLFPVTVPIGGRLIFANNPIKNLSHLADYEVLGEVKNSNRINFNLTDVGRQLLRVYEYTDGVGTGRKVLGACFGTGKIDAVTNFTLPSESGAQASRVTFRWSAADDTGQLLALARQKDLLAMPGNYGPNSGVAQISGTGSAIIQLTNEGWEVTTIDKN